MRSHSSNTVRRGGRPGLPIAARIVSAPFADQPPSAGATHAHRKNKLIGKVVIDSVTVKLVNFFLIGNMAAFTLVFAFFADARKHERHATAKRLNAFGVKRLSGKYGAGRHQSPSGFSGSETAESPISTVFARKWA
jgi:hypothetical protein